MANLVPKTSSSTSIPHTKSETPNSKISSEQPSFHDLEKIEGNIGSESEIPYTISNDKFIALILITREYAK